MGESNVKWMTLIERKSSVGVGDVNRHLALAKVDNKITFRSRENGEFSAHLHIKNTAEGSCSIIYKMKTTSPENFRVKPPIAVIAPGGNATVLITSMQDMSPEQILKDRFLVQVCILPDGEMADTNGDCDNVSSRQSQFSSLNGKFKELVRSCEMAVDTFCVNVNVEPRLTVGGAIVTVSNNEQASRKRLIDLDNKMTDFMNKTDKKLNWICVFLLIILGALIGILTWLLFREYPCNIPENFCATCCPDYVHVSKCGEIPSCPEGGLWPFTFLMHIPNLWTRC